MNDGMSQILEAISYLRMMWMLQVDVCHLVFFALLYRFDWRKLTGWTEKLQKFSKLERTPIIARPTLLKAQKSLEEIEMKKKIV